MRWRKLGRVYFPTGELDWAKTHAMIPTIHHMPNKIVRVYFASCSADIVARVNFLDYDLDSLHIVGGPQTQPAFDIGRPGAFDDSGVNASSIVNERGEIRLYYVGYQRQREIPYTLFSGLAIAQDWNMPFERLMEVPILDRCDGELFFRTAPYVMKDSGNYRMWYVGGSDWVRDGERILPTYAIRTTESSDGVTWSSPGKICLEPERPVEIGLGRPCILKEGNLYRMWYSIRKTMGYRIGYATSPDGIKWTRHDEECGLPVSSSGWDSEMTCYSAVIRHRGSLYQFYNGNGYGRSGLGVAILEDE